MHKYLKILYCTATDCHFWQGICKAIYRTPKVSSWNCWLSDVWCAHQKGKDDGGKRWRWGKDDVGIKSVKDLWEHSQILEWHLLGAAEYWCALCGCHCPHGWWGQHRKATQREQSLNRNSPLMSGHRSSSQQSLCRLPAGRFSYANGLSPLH